MKFKLTKKTKEVFGVTLYQIKALKDFGDVDKGELGGWIEKESNLSQEDDAWVFGDAEVSGNAEVYGDARVFGNARVYGEFKLEFGWCFARKREDWNVTEVKNEDEILLIKDYKPAEEVEETVTVEISKASLEALKESGIKIINNK